MDGKLKYDERLLGNFSSYKVSSNEESNLLFLVFVFVNIFLFVPTIAPPYNTLVGFILIPIVIALNVYGILYKLLFSKKENKTNHFLLFKGVYGGLTSFGLFLVSQKIAYSTNVFDSPFYFIFSFLGYLLLLYVVFRKLERESLIKDTYKKGEIKFSIPKMTAVFYLTANALITYLSSQTFLFIAIIAFLILSWISMYSFFELFRFYFVKSKNNNW